MDSWVFDEIFSIVTACDAVPLIFAFCDLAVHTFFRVAFGWSIRPNSTKLKRYLN